MLMLKKNGASPWVGGAVFFGFGFSPPLGTSPRLGVPSLRPSWFNGAPAIKGQIKIKSSAALKPAWFSWL
jgi:hypothetical protein